MGDCMENRRTYSMKKTISIMIAIMMTLALCSCGDNSSSNKLKYSGSEYLGTWVLEGYEVDGQSFPMGEHEATQLTLNADGTFVDISEAYQEETEEQEAGYQEVTTKGTWEETETGFKTTDDIFTMEYTVDGDTATAEYESTTLIRKRSK